MGKEREVADWVPPELESELGELSLFLESEERKRRKREKQKRKSARRRGKNLRGTLGVTFAYGGLGGEASFWWDPKEKKDILEMPMLQGLGEGEWKRLTQSAEDKQGWRQWEVEFDSERIRIICAYQNRKHPRKIPPERRVALIFGHLPGFSLEEIKRVSATTKEGDNQFMIKSEN